MTHGSTIPGIMMHGTMIPGIMTVGMGITVLPIHTIMWCMLIANLHLYLTAV